MIHSKKIFLDQITPIEIFAKLENYFPDEPALLFESAENGEFSFILLGAKERIQYHTGDSKDPFQNLKDRFSKLDTDFYKRESERLSVPFVDGFIGYIGYEAIELFEPKLKEKIENLENEIDIPDIDLIRPKIVLAYSHKKNTLTILSSESDELFSEIEDILKSKTEFRELKKAKFKSEGSFRHSKESFHKMIQESKKMIRSGDVFQILISNRYKREFDEVDPFSFYRVLRSKNPSPYMFYMNYRDFHIVGSSPEVMVTLRDQNILLRPIAGTRKRGKNINRDRELETEMVNDPKEISEHLMLIDLGRNDIGRVAKSGSVKVSNMFRVERYSHVMHMVSDIEAEIDPKFDMFDLLKATFTAGTMTGAPKIRAMELIADYEKLKRNFYSGVVGYFGFDGNMDSAITIRTALMKDNVLYLHAGAGIVADSVEDLESLEVRNKMNALLSTIEDLQK